MNKLILAVPLAAVLAVSMIVTPTAFASNGNFSPDFRITSVGSDSGMPSLTVEGTAGATTPEAGTIYAYVFVTGTGIFAVTSHPIPDDSDEVEDDTEWHAHKVTLDGNGCVATINDDGDAVLSGNRVSVDNTGSSTASDALTAILTITDEGNVCVKQVMSSASA